jgi:molybdopterin converting factor small subunit
MFTVNVLLSGRLKLDGFGQGRPTAADGTLTLALGDGSTIREAIAGLRVPSDRVVMTMVNGRQCPTEVRLNSGDRVILIPEDVAALWRALGRQNLGMGIGFDS